LLALTLAAFFWMKSDGASDELARTVAVNTLTIGQVFYLLNSRYLRESSFSVKALLGNRYLPMGIGAVVILQLLFTYAPPLQYLFGNEAIPLAVWPWLFAGGFLFFLVVEAEKLIIRLWEPSPGAADAEALAQGGGAPFALSASPPGQASGRERAKAAPIAENAAAENSFEWVIPLALILGLTAIAYFLT
jgi:hypothetical protein